MKLWTHKFIFYLGIHILGMTLGLAIVSVADASGTKESYDPKGYFMKRFWTIALSPRSSLKGISEFTGEPEKTPNQLTVNVECDSGEKLPVIKDMKYCGLDSIKMISGDLKVEFTDFGYHGDQGYCLKKRTQTFKVPSCP